MTTAKDVCAALYRQWAPRHAVLFELTARRDGNPPLGCALDPEWRERRIDALLLKPTRPRYEGDGWERLAVEVKVSRSDFLSDVRDPHKQALWRSLTHAFAYAAPAGLIRPDELPAGAGLIEVGRNGRWGPETGWTKRATWKPGPIGPLPHRVLSIIANRLSQAEALSRGYLSRPGETIEELRATVERCRTEMDNAHRRADRERDLREDWQRRYAAVGDPPCGTCGQPLKARGGRRGTGWQHRDASIEYDCRERRVAAELEARPNASYRYVPEAQPVERLDVSV